MTATAELPLTFPAQLRKVQSAGEDFEWYPTTDEIIAALKRDLSYHISCDYRLKVGHRMVLHRRGGLEAGWGDRKGISARACDFICDLLAWDWLKPSALFLIDRDAPLREEPVQLWQRYRSEYIALAEREEANYPVHVISNNAAESDTLDQIVEILARSI